MDAGFPAQSPPGREAARTVSTVGALRDGRNFRDWILRYVCNAAAASKSCAKLSLD
jgi:hypothetical protein